MERFFMGIDDLDAHHNQPRISGLTEIRGPNHSFMEAFCIKGLLESNGHLIDGLKFKDGSASLMPKSILREIADVVHQHGAYMSTGGWAEHLLAKGPSSFKHYVDECRDIGFDTLELHADHLNMQEDDLLRLVRLIKREGLNVKPQFDVKLGEASSIGELQKEIDTMIGRAERFLASGADMIMFDADGITKGVDEWRTDFIARMIGRLGLDKIMFEADELETAQYFVNRYGSGVNLFIDHSQARDLKNLRTAAGGGGQKYIWGQKRVPF